MKKQEIWSFIGAGGKSTLILLTAARKAEEGKKVLVTTTTHTAFTEDSLLRAGGRLLLGESGEAAAAVLERESPVAALKELPGQREKQQGLPEEELQKAVSRADLVLIEADGSRRRPFKAPGNHEPAVHPDSSRIILAAGLTALGRSIGESCHRLREIVAITGKSGDCLLSERDMAQVIREGYLHKCRLRWPGVPVTVILNQADTGELEERGLLVKKYLEGSGAEVYLFSAWTERKGKDTWNMD